MIMVNRVEATIERALRGKLENYNPEPAYMPFHTRLLGTDRMALYSFIQSLNTTFGTSIFEQVAREVAAGVFAVAETQHRVGNTISSAAQEAIAGIMYDLRTGSINPCHDLEMAILSECAQEGDEVILPRRAVRLADVFLANGNEVYLFDLKTVKPNINDFEKYKQTLLEWAAIVLKGNPDAVVRTVIAMPYNPYHPEPYDRWTLRGMLETENQSQLMVGDEFWNFLAGGVDIYQDLLDCFERVGIRMRGEIDAYFAALGQRRYR